MAAPGDGKLSPIPAAEDCLRLPFALFAVSGARAHLCRTDRLRMQCRSWPPAAATDLAVLGADHRRSKRREVGVRGGRLDERALREICTPAGRLAPRGRRGRAAESKAGAFGARCDLVARFTVGPSRLQSMCGCTALRLSPMNAGDQEPCLVSGLSDVRPSLVLVVAVAGMARWPWFC
jgi:hypothetical protein